MRSPEHIAQELELRRVLGSAEIRLKSRYIEDAGQQGHDQGPDDVAEADVVVDPC